MAESPVAVRDFLNVKARSRQLCLIEPTNFAFLPRNFADAASSSDLLHESAVQTVRSLFRQNNIVETPIERDGQKLPLIQENDFSLILPTLYISYAFYSQNANLIAIALNIIASYAMEAFKGIPGFNRTRLEVVVEKPDGSSKAIRYEGSASGLKDLNHIVGKVFRNEP